MNGGAGEGMKNGQWVPEGVEIYSERHTLNIAKNIIGNKKDSGKAESLHFKG